MMNPLWLGTRAWQKQLLGVVALCLVTGCSGGDSPPLAEATGQVTKAGAPLVNARVEFYPDGPGGSSYGTTDQEGKFELFYSTGDPGAALGTHKVVVIGGSTDAAAVPTAPAAAGEEAGEGTLAPVGMPGGPGRGAGTAEVKGLTAEITADGPNFITLEL
ncbi:transthyretin-like family protein [Roseimaritima ulvae]|uniref:Carboxypeptidase regulatory-like domain-containing protein n=1 Tax=Roseimaritima ulvae TaxID=980254 RepID=A0A5B9QG70_9BACT|nr:carboxypeptidase-like regulatory domain-containing protein [Roseimaritima ulvae]QEG38057.1 hypothetical protein UC8_00100 [Roseimaritima ulvae]